MITWEWPDGCPPVGTRFSQRLFKTAAAVQNSTNRAFRLASLELWNYGIMQCE
jgi:hypothetical protein